MLSFLTLSATLSLAQAAPAAASPACDAKPLVTQLNGAANGEIPAIFLDLVKCDPKVAAKMATDKLPRMPYNERSTNAAIAAIEVGAADAAITWVDKLQSDDRAGAVKALGKRCNESKEVQQFFLDRAAAKPADFWEQRWFRALGECHSDGVQALLWSEAAKGAAGDRSRYFSVLETYAHSAGPAAIPNLTTQLKEAKDGEVQAGIINVYPDAVGVGTMSGMDEKAAKDAVAAIVGAAGELKPKGVEQARLTLTSLNDEPAANKLAGVRYKDDKQKDGTYLWGAVMMEAATCKKGPALRFHVAKVVDNGDLWADQVEPAVQAAIAGKWTLDLATDCKGEGQNTLFVPKSPFADEKAFTAWVDGIWKENQNPEVKKPGRVDEPALSL